MCRDNAAVTVIFCGPFLTVWLLKQQIHKKKIYSCYVELNMNIIIIINKLPKHG